LCRNVSAQFRMHLFYHPHFAAERRLANRRYTINIHRLSRWFFRCGQSPALRAALYSANVACARILFLLPRKRVFQLKF
jgi:hypothetical protein